MTQGRFIDQMGREVQIPNTPVKIVSLVPSITELLHFLGFDKEVVGITKFCIHPKKWQDTKHRIGGTKNLNIQNIIALEPDIVIGNKEENTREDISALEKKVPIWMSEINSFNDALGFINCMGLVLKKEDNCRDLIQSLKHGYKELIHLGKGREVLYFIWNDPPYIAGKATFISAMLEQIGFVNACKEERYPSIDNLSEYSPALVFLSSEPFPFGNKHLSEYQKRFPNADVILVDGEMFSWYGSRMLDAIPYFNNKFKDS